jgi:apolipoprotein N-acyltransferase
LSIRAALVRALAAAVCFHVAHLVPYSGFAMLGFFLCLLSLTGVNNARHAFRWGIVLGWLVYTPHLSFFWNVFVPQESMTGAKVIGVIGVIALWMVLPIWLGLFLSLATWLRRWTRPVLWIWLIPAAWTGIEYVRGELYPLKFSWLSAGYAFAESPWMLPFGALGMYGAGFLLVLLATFTRWGWRRSKPGAGLLLLGVPYALTFTVIALSGRIGTKTPVSELTIGGVQLEFPSYGKVLRELDHLIAEHPETELCVLSEYTFSEPVPEVVRNWCRDNRRYLIAGGTDPLGTTNFYNTAFVIGTQGEIVFKQAKGVPIQFFSDGLPAPKQEVWDSPWGRIGLCICYDLGYTRVTDELVRQGAETIIAPTMDVQNWGGYQHWLHARVTPIRAAEYGIPIFRLTSSGVSQHVLPSGKVQASRPYPGQGAILTAQLELRESGSLPLDRWFAPLCVIVTTLTALVAMPMSFRRSVIHKRAIHGSADEHRKEG